MPIRRNARPPGRRFPLSKARAPLGLLALVLCALIGVTLTVTVRDGEAPPRSVTVTVADAQREPVKVTTPASTVTAARDGLESHADGAGDARPAEVPTPAWEAGKRQRAAFAATDDLPATIPLAAQSAPGCRSYLIPRNFSSGGGVRKRLIVVHYTVSPNRPGWSDVLGIVAWFSRAMAQASSHYVLDAEGHCALLVPEAAKAWTQVGFNPVSVSIEVINTGKETAAWQATQPALVKLIRSIGARWDIPMRRGAISGCSVVRSGIVDHDQLGACGGGHFDVKPFDIGETIAKARAAGSSLAKDRARTCARLRYHRAKAKRAGWTPARVARVKALKNHARKIGLDEAACRA